MKKLIFSIGLLTVFLIPGSLWAQQTTLRQQIAELAKPAKGIVGVAVYGLEDRDTLTYNGSARLVMHSVFKLPIAMTVLHLVDSGVYKLDQMVHIKKRDLRKNTHSPLRDKFPKGNVDVPISDLLSYMVSQSDNNACDILLAMIGGPQVVQAYMLRSGIRGIAIHTNEYEMSQAWEVQFTNWCKPVEMTLLLDNFYTGHMLSKTSTGFLWKILTETSTGPNRIKGLLPAGTVVGHKTGSSPTNAEGLSPATNDVGIITMPNGKHVAISIFVCNSTADEATRESVIAKIARAVYDAYAH
jgi:beta-lactamase class A